MTVRTDGANREISREPSLGKRIVIFGEALPLLLLSLWCHGLLTVPRTARGSRLFTRATDLPLARDALVTVGGDTRRVRELGAVVA